MNVSDVIMDQMIKGGNNLLIHIRNKEMNSAGEVNEFNQGS